MEIQSNCVDSLHVLIMHVKLCVLMYLPETPLPPKYIIVVISLYRLANSIIVWLSALLLALQTFL